MGGPHENPVSRLSQRIIVLFYCCTTAVLLYDLLMPPLYAAVTVEQVHGIAERVTHHLVSKEGELPCSRSKHLA